jgi:hypothetical protein
MAGPWGVSTMSSESLLLPDLGVLMEGQALDRETLERIEVTLVSATCPEAYLRAASPGATRVLLFFRGRAHLAARIEGESLRPSTLAEFFEHASETVHYRLCRADPGLILVLSILSQHDPTMKVPLRVSPVTTSDLGSSTRQ